MKKFCHLHCHASHSSLDGLGSPSTLAMNQRKLNGTLEECEKRGGLIYDSIALSDHGSIGGVLELIKSCSSTKDKMGKLIPYPTIKPIIGNELYCTLDVKEKNPIYGNYHLLAIAMNSEGYQNLCELTEKSYEPDNFYSKPRIDFELLERYNEGLIVSTACVGSIVNANLAHGKYDEARRICGVLKSIFGDRFYIEVMYHGLDIEKRIIPDLLKIAKELNIKVFASNDVHYASKNLASSQDVLLCMSMKKCVADTNRMKFSYDEFYLKTVDEMLKVFKDCPSVIDESVELANRVDSDSINKFLFGHIRLPSFPLPEEFKKQSNDPFKYLEKLTWEGAKSLGWTDQKHIDRINLELSEMKSAKLYNNLDFATYFLHLKRGLDMARNEKEIWTGSGRGSSYASCVLRCLKINTGPIDPIEYNLSWGRFLGFSSQVAVFDSDFIEDEELTIKERDIDINNIIIENEEISEESEEENSI
jgi:DNA polymerase-3 subunit alpha